METIIYDSDKIKGHTKTKLRDRLDAVQTAIEEAVEAMESLDDAQDPDDRADARAAALEGVESILSEVAELRTYCDSTLADA